MNRDREQKVNNRRYDGLKWFLEEARRNLDLTTQRRIEQRRKLEALFAVYEKNRKLEPFFGANEPVTRQILEAKQLLCDMAKGIQRIEKDIYKTQRKLNHIHLDRLKL